MQNSQQKRSLARKLPRHARRGALMPAALLAVLIATVLMSQFAQARLRQVRDAQSAARAVHLAAIAADFDTYVHVNRDDLQSRFEGSGSTTRSLTNDERILFEQAFLRAGVTRRMPGLDLDYQIRQADDGTAVLGALHLSATETRGRGEMDALIARLARHGASGSGLDQASSGSGGRDEDERLILTAPLSGLNTAYVLRARRAGHAPPKLVGARIGVSALDLDGHALRNVKTLTAMGDEASTARRVEGRLRTSKMTGTLKTLQKTRTDPDDTVPAIPSGIIEVAGTTKVSGTFDVTGTLRSGALGGLRSVGGTGESGYITMNIGGIILIQDWVKANMLTTAMMGPLGPLATRHITLDGAASIDGHLSTEALHSPTVAVSGEFTAGQVFTKEAEVGDLDITGECHGC